jgi:hypothetical protein
VARYLPELPEQARPISEYEARRRLITSYLDTVGAAREKDIQRLFGWPAPLVERELKKLVAQNAIRSDIQIEGEKGDWLASPLV